MLPFFIASLKRHQFPAEIKMDKGDFNTWGQNEQGVLEDKLYIPEGWVDKEY